MPSAGPLGWCNHAIIPGEGYALSLCVCVGVLTGEANCQLFIIIYQITGEVQVGLWAAHLHKTPPVLG